MNNRDQIIQLPPRYQLNVIRSDEGLTLETSSFRIFHGSNSTFINSFDKTKFSCFVLSPTQHQISLETRNLFTWQHQTCECFRQLLASFAAVFRLVPTLKTAAKEARQLLTQTLLPRTLPSMLLIPGTGVWERVLIGNPPEN